MVDESMIGGMVNSILSQVCMIRGYYLRGEFYIVESLRSGVFKEILLLSKHDHLREFGRKI